ncbi:MAG: alpha/beta fold hydrolase, partial [Acidobacteriota bacterium]
MTTSSPVQPPSSSLIRDSRFLLGAALIALLTSGCPATESPPAEIAEEPPAESLAAPPLAERAVTLEERTLELEEGGSLAYDRGLIEVPMNRRTQSEKTLEVEFFRFRHRPDAEQAAGETDRGAPPIFMLRGGPGFGGLGPSLEESGYYESRLAPWAAVADVVVPGQRGFGSSGATPCDPRREMTFEEVFDEEISKAVVQEATAACRQKYEALGYDLQGFNALEAAADVVEIARSLGYETIQLWGVSFGSHWGMTTLRLYPESVARATFGGLEGPDHTYDMPSYVKAALERMAASAQADPKLASLMPEEGLIDAYQAMVEARNAEPVTMDISIPPADGAEGEETTAELEVDGDLLKSFAWGYSGTTAFRHRARRWPLDLLTLIDGDYEPALGGLGRAIEDRGLNDAAYFQIDCASGLSAERGATLRSDPAAALLGETWDYYDSYCASWDADLGEAFRRPFESSVPVLMVQGNWDTSTPYENALELRPFFTSHRFVHVEGGSHGALREAIGQVEGFRE